MNILLSFDDRFTFPTKVMLKSLILNNSCLLNIYVFYINLSSESIDSIMELCQDSRVKFFFKKIEKESFNNFPIRSQWPLEACIRLFAYKYLDESINRILWIDGDMIINGSIEEFYNQDLGDNFFAAVEDYDAGKNPERHKQIGMPLDKIYVNSGFLLFNLKIIRNNSYEKDIFEYIENYEGKLNFPDQDVLNGVFYDKIKVSDSGFNYNCLTWCIDDSKNKEFVKNIKVIHYGSNQKPWVKKYRYPCFVTWWKYALKCGDKTIRKQYMIACCYYCFRRVAYIIQRNLRIVRKHLFTKISRLFK